MDELEKVEVKLNHAKVGILTLFDSNVLAFQYDESFLKAGFSISPFFLPLENKLFVAKAHPFSGNFGVFSDSLPDGWGSLLLDRHLKSLGLNPARVSLLNKLCLVGTQGKGALEFFPEQTISTPQTVDNLHQIAQEIFQIYHSESDNLSLDKFVKLAGSSGGARPKIHLLFDNQDWIVKFRAQQDPINVGEIEYNYSILAKRCGIEMMETKLFENQYFGTKRFDRELGNKYHVVSVAALLNADYRIPCIDYLDILKLCRLLSKSEVEVEKVFKLMIFNLLIENKDDHAKNFSFIYKNGRWFFSPAYDLLPSSGFNGYHTTTVNGSGEPSLQDIIKVGIEIGFTKSYISDFYEFIRNEILSNKF